MAPVSLFDVAKACGECMRLELLVALRRGPTEVGELARLRDLPVAGVSYHLKSLANAGLVSYSQRGKYHLYALTRSVSLRVNGGTFILRVTPDDGCAFQLEITQHVGRVIGLEHASPPPVVHSRPHRHAHISPVTLPRAYE
jgi:DNA-binding transcriptional ArsR family regulator